MNAVKKILKFLLCYLCSLIVVYLNTGFIAITEKLEESKAIAAWLTTSLLLAIVVMMILELHLKNKNRIAELEERVSELEEKSTHQ